MKEHDPMAASPVSADTLVFHFDTDAARRAFYETVFPGNPFKWGIIAGARVTSMAAYDMAAVSDIYEDALRAIADGARRPEEIAEAALDRASDRMRLNALQAQGAKP